MRGESARDRLKRFERRIRRRRVISQIPVVRLKDRENPFENYNSAEFKQRYHMFKSTAHFLLELIGPKLISPLRRGCQLPPAIQFLAVVRFYCTGSFELVIGDYSGMSQSTMSKLIKRVSIQLATLRPRFIKFPTFAEAPEVRQRFYEIGHFPGLVP
jgi:hypothetical protein